MQCRHGLGGNDLADARRAGSASAARRRGGAAAVAGTDAAFAGGPPPRALRSWAEIGATLVAKWAWAAAGGYPELAGVEDFALQCRFAELGLQGAGIAGAPPAGSIPPAARASLTERHPWLADGL